MILKITSNAQNISKEAINFTKNFVAFFKDAKGKKIMKKIDIINYNYICLNLSLSWINK